MNAPSVQLYEEAGRWYVVLEAGPTLVVGPTPEKPGTFVQTEEGALYRVLGSGYAIRVM